MGWLGLAQPMGFKLAVTRGDPPLPASCEVSTSRHMHDLRATGIHVLPPGWDRLQSCVDARGQLQVPAPAPAPSHGPSPEWSTEIHGWRSGPKTRTSVQRTGGRLAIPGGLVPRGGAPPMPCCADATVTSRGRWRQGLGWCATGARLAFVRLRAMRLRVATMETPCVHFRLARYLAVSGLGPPGGEIGTDVDAPLQ